MHLGHLTHFALYLQIFNRWHLSQHLPAQLVHVSTLLHVTHLVMVGEGEHWNTMSGWGGNTMHMCVYILYIDKHIIVTNGSITGLLRQPDQVVKLNHGQGDMKNLVIPISCHSSPTLGTVYKFHIWPDVHMYVYTSVVSGHAPTTGSGVLPSCASASLCMRSCTSAWWTSHMTCCQMCTSLFPLPQVSSLPPLPPWWHCVLPLWLYLELLQLCCAQRSTNWNGKVISP